MLGIELVRHSEVTLARQIYCVMREQMTDGRLQPGEALPSTRELARALNISRNTAYEAYEMLSAEGYIVCRQGSPTRVSPGLHLAKSLTVDNALTEKAPYKPQYLVNFRSGQPDLRQFPRYAWLQLMEKTSREFSMEEWGYAGPDGMGSLREEIAAWLLRSRGLHTHAHNIFITSGATQALHLIPQLIGGDRRDILVEDPCHLGMLRVLKSQGLSIRPVPVDRHGICTDKLDAHGACAIYLTPSHQFPLGGILPAERRAALIRAAHKHDLYLIEDDYDSEFRYSGPPIAPLHAMDPQRVLYVGTFSKILFPALRIGYVVLPPDLQKSWRFLRTHLDVQNPPFEQAALAEYIKTRRLDRHIQKMRRLYGQKRQILLQTLTATFKEPWNVWGDAAGLHLVIECPGLSFGADFISHCKRAGINLASLEEHCILKGVHTNKLILGYGHLDAEEILKGIKMLHQLIHNYHYDYRVDSARM